MAKKNMFDIPMSIRFDEGIVVRTDKSLEEICKMSDDEIIEEFADDVEEQWNNASRKLRDAEITFVNDPESIEVLDPHEGRVWKYRVFFSTRDIPEALCVDLHSDRLIKEYEDNREALNEHFRHAAHLQFGMTIADDLYVERVIPFDSDYPDGTAPVQFGA